MRRVMVFGSFDPLHDGHRSLFRQARKHGDELVVVVARDVNIARLKGHAARASEQERLARVEAEPLVDTALMGDEKDFFKNIVAQLPDVLILGYDQTTFTDEELREKLAKRGLNPEIKRAVAFKPEENKSSKILENS